jgi:DNA replication protein DnaC
MAAGRDAAAHLTVRLKELRLPAIRACYREEAENARKASLTYERYLAELVEREAEARRCSRVERLLRASKLPPGKTMASFDASRLPAKVASQLSVLLEGSFLDRAENVLAFGNPGSGKTHLLSAIGHELVHQDRRVVFTTCGLLVQDLLVAKRELRLAKALKKLAKFEALIIDDIGYVQHDREEMEVLFTLLAERYERRSVMLTSNLPFSKWELIFKDPMTTAAAIDRLVHHSVILELNLSSYRLEHSKGRKVKAGEESQQGKAARGQEGP